MHAHPRQYSPSPPQTPMSPAHADRRRRRRGLQRLWQRRPRRLWRRLWTFEPPNAAGSAAPGQAAVGAHRGSQRDAPQRGWDQGSQRAGVARPAAGLVLSAPRHDRGGAGRRPILRGVSVVDCRRETTRQNARAPLHICTHICCCCTWGLRGRCGAVPRVHNHIVCVLAKAAARSKLEFDLQATLTY